MPESDLPWSVPVLVAQVPESGLHQVLEATPDQRSRIAAVAGVNAVLVAVARLEVTHGIEGRINVSGKVRARVEQTCVVSLDPFENDVEEIVTAVFAPPSQIPASPKPVQKEQGEDTEIPDPPEPIVNGAIDLGQLVTEFLLLGIDPYPRKPGAAFNSPQTPEDPDEHPFAALKALKATSDMPPGKKPKEK